MELTREELLAAIKQLQPKEYEPNQSVHGAITSPTDRYAHLPEPTRKWLEGLRQEDLTELNEAQRLYRKAKIILGAAKWLVVALVGALLVSGRIGEAAERIYGYFVN